MRILQVGTIDEGGGAATVASGLMRQYRARGHQVRHIVGRKRSDDEDVIVLPDDRRALYRLTGYSAAQVGLRRLAGHYPNRGFGLASRVLRYATHPLALTDMLRGVEDFRFAGTSELLDLATARPEVVQCHNLHGGYFDLRELCRLSHQVPTVLTLHDMWTLTGHCAYALGCERWKTGCGSCPDLRLDPAIRRDATAQNWTNKRSIYSRSRLHIAVPSRWLAECVQQSMLGPFVHELKVIPNGVDLTIFHPGDKRAARSEVGLPADRPIVLLTMASPGSMWKDDRTVSQAVERVAATAVNTPLFVTLGRATALPRHVRVESRVVEFQNDPRVVASYLRAADVYVHSARADNAPLAVLEALACGTPVVATRVGGISEQIRPADVEALEGGKPLSTAGATGVLVPERAAASMASAAGALLGDLNARVAIAENAVRDARERFDISRQANEYVHWFGQLGHRREEAAVG